MQSESSARPVVGDAADAGVHARASQRFGIRHLAYRGFDQIGAAQAHEAGISTMMMTSLRAGR